MAAAMNRRAAGSHGDRWKRATDVVLAGLALIVTAPLQLVIAAVVRVRLGSPVLFRQERPGLHERPFTLVKFRTMVDTADGAPAGPAADRERLTPLGRWLRATSLDELPTLWNVVRGDMSLVGPRPLLMAYLDRYTAEQRRRHEVRPGITGLAQVRGRNGLSWEEKFALDVEYVQRQSTRLDAIILARTVSAVLSRRGISAAGAATMPEFRPQRYDLPREPMRSAHV
jgi:lipopolysaccharide/colanic/teichoic acid biosynthesis glycosyltransferase